MPPQKRKRKTATKKPRKPSPTPETTATIQSLPDDLLLSCLARVSRLHYPTLSLVSKRFRSLLASPELNNARKLLNRKENCLYVCLQFTSDSNPRWFSLCCKPDQTHTSKKKKKSSGFVLATLPVPQSPPAHEFGLVSIGSKIYNIGGPINDSPSARVSVLDCHSQTWQEAPMMRVERNYPAAVVCDGKIYVAGGCKDSNSSNWMEVFDPKTQTWEPVLSPLGAERCKSQICRSAVIEGQLYMFGNKGVAYKPKEDRWEAISELTSLYSGWIWYCYCVIDNVIYSFKDSKGIMWYDSKVGLWKNLKGLVGLPKFAQYACVKLADYGGNMVVLWDKYLPSSDYKEKMIWCAEIALERRDRDEDGDEIWGKVEWLDGVLKVPALYYDLLKVIAASL